MIGGRATQRGASGDAMPYRKVQAGDTVFVRAIALAVCSDAVQVRIEDFPSMAITAWAPATEVALQPDLAELRPHRRLLPMS